MVTWNTDFWEIELGRVIDEAREDWVKINTYAFARWHGHKARVDGVWKGAKVARGVEAALDDIVILGMEVKFNDISHSCYSGVGREF